MLVGGVVFIVQAGYLGLLFYYVYRSLIWPSSFLTRTL